MSLTGDVTRAIFWLHAVGGVAVAVFGLLIPKLFGYLDLAAAGIEKRRGTAVAIGRGIPVAGVLLCLAAAGRGLKTVAAEIAAVDSAGTPTVVEEIAMAVPGGTVEQVAGVLGLVLLNASILVVIGDLSHQWAVGD